MNTTEHTGLPRRAVRRLRAAPGRVQERLRTPRDLRAAVKDARRARRFTDGAGIAASWSNVVVVGEASARGLLISTDERGRVRISDGHRTRWYDDGKVSINARMARRAVHNKQVTARLLQAHGLRAPQGEVFGPGETDRAWAWAEPLIPLVLKPTNADMGQMVHVGIRDRAEFDSAFNQIAQAFEQVMVEEFVTGVEHRVVVVDGTVVAATRRVPAHVVGDGRTDVAGLVTAKNRWRRDSPNPIHRQLRLGAEELRELGRQDLQPISVPRAGQVVHLRSTSNIHTGGDAVDATDELSPAEVQFVQRAARVFTGLRLGGFDMLLPRDGQGSEPCVLEINGGPMISMHHFPWQGHVRDVAGALLDAMFPATAARTAATSACSPH